MVLCWLESLVTRASACAVRLMREGIRAWLTMAAYGCSLLKLWQNASHRLVWPQAMASALEAWANWRGGGRRARGVWGCPAGLQPGVSESPCRCDEAGPSPAPEGLLRADAKAAPSGEWQGGLETAGTGASSAEFMLPREDGAHVSRPHTGHGGCRPPGTVLLGPVTRPSSRVPQASRNKKVDTAKEFWNQLQL